MARPRILLLLLLCLVLSPFSFTRNAYGLRKLGPVAPYPSLSPSEGRVDMGIGDQAPAISHIIRRHHSLDKSMAGGDLILGGFSTALLNVIRISL
ncbi:hypothetical protein RND71_012134 [Anisodus tanguticus]|uniref:Uncharacterized protein n=1 Tax=Anisodus tanguticus TaxID=243964 RepID=A0AAE1SF58_9SOLA|nr:hypothetical protein RND71_012134 [Anisodus tanguticus]